ncbi:MAG: 2-amino-4-hydroxy-6-hydroxymethyldihydropteridine diphosphokinase [Acidobacteria bacterium]|nr:2-amino-4-hydroxy-6-hydroxymethyldihydropteridine diphosphokinase [Acidobacteriota bacterium]
MTRAFIALGSNLRPRSANLCAALGHLRRLAEVRSVSTFHRTEAVAERGVRAADPEFLNAAAALETDLGAHELLAALLGIEAALGRDRTAGAAGPRTIDLDLLLFGDCIIDTPGLVVPHPRMHRRHFVLEPLSEIAPNAWHPGLRKTVAELRAALVVPPTGRRVSWPPTARLPRGSEDPRQQTRAPG